MKMTGTKWKLNPIILVYNKMDISEISNDIVLTLPKFNLTPIKNEENLDVRASCFSNDVDCHILEFFWNVSDFFQNV